MDWPLRFGIFMAPFHPVGQNPTLALERDLDLIEHLDRARLRRGVDRRAPLGRLRDHRHARRCSSPPRPSARSTSSSAPA